MQTKLFLALQTDPGQYWPIAKTTPNTQSVEEFNFTTSTVYSDVSLFIPEELKWAKKVKSTDTGVHSLKK